MSEKYDWKKFCDESKPTEEEQDRWSKLSILIAATLGVVAVLLEA